MHFLNIHYESTNIKIVYIFKEVAYIYIYIPVCMKKQYSCTGKYLRFLKYLPCM